MQVVDIGDKNRRQMRSCWGVCIQSVQFYSPGLGALEKEAGEWLLAMEYPLISMG